MSMTPRQVLQAVTSFKEPDRLPISISALSILQHREGYTQESFLRLPPQEQAEFAYQATRTYGGDMLQVGLGGTLAVKALGGKVKFRAHGPADVTEPLIENISDLDKIDLDRVKEDEHYQNALEVARHTLRLAGDEYPVSVGSWGLYTQAGLLYGAEKLMRGSIRDKAAIRALLDFTFELLKATTGEIVDMGASVGSLADPTASGDMISRELFAELALPYLRKVYDWYRSKGLLTSLHICGNINDRIGLIPETGVNILSIDYKVDIGRAAKLLKGKTVIGGNADPVAVIMQSDAEAVRKAYLEIIERVGNAPYIVMAGCGIPSRTPLENIQAMVDIAHHTVPKYS
ncbi:Uroporphyrinogen decarboxylase (URO-D) [Syntrophobotulus glycolicus DSM 8271]|uniref:Uroporphyrinogen decarboxylase (URO-D) n=1 Tax=Syntrophobotulus glycolicus (strain DSM 8271 / FlGlyR) TaxID=645991 RepID=F0T2I6_SYNGF|nr:uroporphyrinogen decarboxylase family protein [Syntrophobotulus glycolicus]ADY55304.1 Uroporphyrinogen decarboxylase (URO-D) [Syntrophobotulus glycolicus DSM 8271]